MVFDLQIVSDWLLKSVWGVLTIGALGSIVGAGVLYVVKRLAQRFVASREEWTMTLLWFAGREFLVGREVRDAIGPKAEDGKFLAYLLVQIFAGVADVVFFTLWVGLAAFVAIAYGLDRPILLASLIALALLFARMIIKFAMRMHGLLDAINLFVIEKLSEVPPRSFSKWRELQENKAKVESD